MPEQPPSLLQCADNTKPVQTRTPRARRKLRWENTFLRELARTGNVTAACASAGVGRTTAYEHAERHPDFQEAWKQALEAACDALELEARRRAHDGVDAPVIYRGQLCGTWVDAQGRPVAEGTVGATLVPLTTRKYSDSLLMFLLKAHRPDKFRERIGKGGEPTEIDLDQAMEAELARIAGHERRTMFIALGEVLAPYPEAKERVSRMLQNHLEKAKPERDGIG
jgi:hypothetical protein